MRDDDDNDNDDNNDEKEQYGLGCVRMGVGWVWIEYIMATLFGVGKNSHGVLKMIKHSQYTNMCN